MSGYIPRHLFVVAALALPGIATADGGSFEHVHCFIGTAHQTIEHSDANFSTVATLNGTVRSMAPGEIFDGMASQCTLLLGQTQGNVHARGSCEWTDLDGDRLFFEYERANAAGRFKSIAGTGKYQTVSMEGTYEALRAPQTPGVLRGCARNTGRWDRR